MQTWRDIGNVEAETLVYTLVDTLSETGVKIIGDTQGNVNSKQLTHTMTETLGNSKNRQLSENWPIRRLKHFSLTLVTCLTVAEVEIRCKNNVHNHGKDL